MLLLRENEEARWGTTELHWEASHGANMYWASGLAKAAWVAKSSGSYNMSSRSDRGAVSLESLGDSSVLELGCE